MLNRKLSNAGKPMMHYQTLDLMARHGVDVMLDPPIEFLPTLLDRKPSPGSTFPPFQDTQLEEQNSAFEQGQCLACDETGPLYHL